MKVLITGGARGIGKSISEIFAKNGYDLCINYNKSEKEALLLQKELQDLYDIKVKLIKADLSDLSSIHDLYQKLKTLYPDGVDILINNSGVCIDELFDKVEFEKVQKLYNINLLSVVELTRLVVSDMIKKKSGSIINISSVSGVLGCSCEVDYSTTKAAINGFTKALAKEVGESNINVNAVAPGIIKTDMTCDLDEEYCLSNIPLHRYGSANEVAKLVYDISQNKYITGQIIGIDGAIVI